MINYSQHRSSRLLPALAVAGAGALWGLFWIPMRAFESSDLPGDWLAFLFFATPALVMLPLVLWRRSLPSNMVMAVLLTGLFTGAGSALYSISLVLTTVVKALLLFYLTPVWSTLLECFILGARLRFTRIIALMMGFLGLTVILETDGIPVPDNPGDWIALLSGMVWAYGTVRVHSQQNVPLCEAVFSYFSGGSVCAMLVILLPIGAFTATPDVFDAVRHLPVVMAIGTGMAVCMVLVFWGTLRLTAARVGLLLMAEVVIGMASASLLTDEPFGSRELLGSVLIIGAAVIEVIQPGTRPPR